MNIKPRWIVITLLVLALATGVGRALSTRHQQQASAQAQAPAITQIELAPSDVWVAEPRQITRNLAISGTLKALNYAVIKARVAGELKELTVREGDVVKAGQVLARIDPTEYQRRWQQANEQARAAKAQMEIAQRQWDTNQALVDQGFIAKKRSTTPWLRTKVRSPPTKPLWRVLMWHARPWTMPSSTPRLRVWSLCAQPRQVNV